MTMELDNISFNSQWFAVWTRSRQEKVAAAMLESLGVPNFLPLKSEVRRWSDRTQTVTLPLFSGYLFVRMNPTKDSRLQVLKAPGIAGFVGNQHGPLPIPDDQVDGVRRVLHLKMDYAVSPAFEVGDLVRVVRGSLSGLQGMLIRSQSKTRLVISIAMIQRSLAVNVSPQDVELVQRSAA